MKKRLDISSGLHNMIQKRKAKDPVEGAKFENAVGQAIVASMKKLQSSGMSLNQIYGVSRKSLEWAVSKLHEEIPKQGVKISCGKGCSACCHLMVYASDVEVDAITAHIVDKEIAIDVDRLKLQNAKQYTEDEYLRLDRRVNPCIFLGKDGACRIYDVRPLACMRHFVSNDPADCANPNMPIGAVYSVEAEIIVSTFMNLASKSERSFLHEKMWRRVNG